LLDVADQVAHEAHLNVCDTTLGAGLREHRLLVVRASLTQHL
jgi:hypothetical protein